MSRLCWQNMIVALLVILCVTTFFACSQEVVTHGLEIVEDEKQVAELTPQQIDELTTALYGVMERLAASTSFSAETIADQLQNVSQYVAQEVALLTPTPQEYMALTAVLERYMETENLSAGALADNLYMDLTSALGKEKCAILLHHVLLSYCNNQAQNYQEAYDQYEFDALLEEAQRYRNKYQILSTRLTPSDLFAVLNTYYLVGAVRSLAQQTDGGNILSIDESLMLIKAQNCTAVALDTEVWYELITLAQDFVTDKYYGKIVETAIGNGDMQLLAEGANDLLALLRHVQMTISAQEIQDIQRGKPIANVILSLLDDDQLNEIDAWLSKGWHDDKYDELAQKQYGNGYLQFVQNTRTLTLDQLLEERHTDPDVDTLLVGYLAGKSYALAWEVQP